MSENELDSLMRQADMSRKEARLDRMLYLPTFRGGKSMRRLLFEACGLPSSNPRPGEPTFGRHRVRYDGDDGTPVCWFDSIPFDDGDPLEDVGRLTEYLEEFVYSKRRKGASI